MPSIRSPRNRWRRRARSGTPCRPSVVGSRSKTAGALRTSMRSEESSTSVRRIGTNIRARPTSRRFVTRSNVVKSRDKVAVSRLARARGCKRPRSPSTSMRSYRSTSRPRCWRARRARRRTSSLQTRAPCHFEMTHSRPWYASTRSCSRASFAASSRAAVDSSSWRLEVRRRQFDSSQARS